MPSNSGQFILLFIKMALFLGVLIVFTVSSFEFQQVRLPWFHCYDEWPQFTQPQCTGLSGLGAMSES